MYSSLASSGQSPSSLPLPSSGSSYPSSVAPGIDAQRTKQRYQEYLAEWQRNPVYKTETGQVLPAVKPTVSPSGTIYYQKPDPYLTNLIDRTVLSNFDANELKVVTIPAEQILSSRTVQSVLQQNGIDPSRVEGLQVSIIPYPDLIYFSASVKYKTPEGRPVVTAFTWGNFVPAAGRGQSPS